uniref:Uncharacterized protein n=1 Tax=Mucochytrium quahogii TaxID=96639 RepID=A0A7S2RIK5_9STRA|mmetsp:Transcript_31291/g.50250  ORF Transcript_31291/g.50250 Transcript_31291/m.50250 type:complete len:125 (-) Transcript_31291:482-856(-)
MLHFCKEAVQVFHGALANNVDIVRFRVTPISFALSVLKPFIVPVFRENAGADVDNIFLLCDPCLRRLLSRYQRGSVILRVSIGSWLVNYVRGGVLLDFPGSFCKESHPSQKGLLECYVECCHEG